MAKLQNIPVSVAGHAANAAFAEFDQRKSKPKDMGPKTLAAFAHVMRPDYDESRVTRLFCEKLEALERADIRKLMIFSPPREGKTTHSSELFPAWFLGRRPNLQVILSSYNDELSERNSRAVRDLITDDERWPYHDCQVRSDVKGVSHWQTTKGGVVRAAGVGGGATGFGADLLDIDDPIKNQEEAMSAPLRDRAWNWYSTVGRTRLMAGARQLITLTRWHEDDLAGRILNSAGASEWEVVVIPMQSEGDGDVFSRPEGEYLNGRIPENDVPSVARGEISETDYAALYQQRPASLEGNMFKRDDWMFYDRDEMMNSQNPLVPMFTTVDTAFKTQASNDWSVAATWGTYRGRAYLIDLWRAKVAFPQLILELHKVYKRWGVPLIIEDRASGQSAIQVMGSAIEQGGNAGGEGEELARALSFGQDRIPIVAFKIPRYATDISLAQAVTPYVQAHAVCLPKGEPWLEAFVQEHASFPAGAHNDQVRTTAMALPRLFAAVVQSQQAVGKPRWTTYRIGSPMDDGGSLDAVLSRELFGS